MAVQTENVTSKNADMDEFPQVKAPFGLKMLVIVLGVAIIGMLALIFYKIADELTKAATKDPDAQETTVSANAAPADTGQAVSRSAGSRSAPTVQSARPDAGGDYTLPRPEGASLTSTTVRDWEVVLQFRGVDGSDTILILDRASGKVTRIHVPVVRQDN
ncbi:hypothetical protein GCM10017044_17500 [Kordiimonas sediminis]|uniref:Uncharacterized protein n=1 Tax=Kordiimonas sediminis TaxID=1735581 RepID=A0A919ATW6_9PROT|nr:hypothetical protein [Kordiimonas sediminis]GHF23472.1 hypothetical protein GCM10017044_17500 [Kordiimonas sediminis]